MNLTSAARRPPRLTRFSARALLVLLLGGLLLGFGAGSAAAKDAERISSYDVAIEVRPNATLHLREEIVYDFGTTERHGIIRDIPVREPYDDERDRVYRVTNLSVSSPSGAPADLAESHSGDMLSLRVGDPDRTITGAQTYVFEYDLEGALNAFDSHDELYWDAVGDGWAVPIDRATASVQTPGTISRVACFAGPLGANDECAQATVEGNRAEFAHAGLPPHNALTVVVAVPKGQVTVPPPQLADREAGFGGGFGGGFYLDPLFGSVAADLAAAAGLTALAAAGAFLGWLRTGRDHTYVGQIAGLAPASDEPAETRPRPVVGRRPAVAPEFTPPDNLRPGLVGTLLDERAQPVDVTATIVDLAVRGYLRIEEVESRGLFSRSDWRLVRLREPDTELRPYERELHERLFSGRSEVRLSDLKQKFAADLAKVERELYTDIVRLGWFKRSPRQTRGLWLAAGMLVAFAGVALTVVRGLDRGELVHVGLIGAGIVVMIASRWMPARTASGSAALARVLGFRRYLATAEAEQLRYEEAEQVFSRYLPYAIVFGETERWARTFAPLWERDGAAPPTWYVGGGGRFDPADFGTRMSSFTKTTSGAISAHASSSSGGSGFSGGASGGGGGGGGGSSW